MIKFLRCLHSDFIKTKRHPILLVHILVPATGILLFLLCDVFHQSDSAGSTASGLLGAVAVSFPTLIGVVCSMMAEQESEAGNFQGLLTFPTKLLPFLSLAALLLLLGLGSVLLVSFGFEAAFAVILHQSPLGPDFYFQGALLLFGSNLFLYLLHLFLSLRFNKGVSIGIGIVESLVSALLITGMGDGIWFFIPCAWGLRFLRLFETRYFGGAVPADCGQTAGLIFCVVGTALLFLLSLVWFFHWEGKKSEE